MFVYAVLDDLSAMKQVTERLTRVGPSTINYEFTVIDPLTYTGIQPQATVSRPGSDGWSGAGATLTLGGGAGNSAVEYALSDGIWTAYTEVVRLPVGVKRLTFEPLVQREF